MSLSGSLCVSLLSLSICVLSLCMSPSVSSFITLADPHQAFALLPWAPPYLSSPTLFFVAPDKGLTVPLLGEGDVGRRKTWEEIEGLGGLTE